MKYLGEVIERVEDAVTAGIEAGHLYRARYNGKFWLRNKSDLRGYRCHCPTNQGLHLVHSEGLREGADVVVDFNSNVASPHRRQVPVESLVRIAPQIGGGDVVHVKANRLPQFLDSIFPRISGPIVLVTGDADYAPVIRHQELLEDPRIIHWFAQNCDYPGRHPRLTRIPIGVDNPKYSALEKRLGFLLATLGGRNSFDLSFSRNDMGDQLLLQRVIGNAKRPFEKKPPRALCTFHMNQRFIPNFQEVPDRVEAYETLKSNPACDFVARRIPQAQCWQMHEDFAFELSPRGNGLDCFRTWEALALGCVPIVKTTTLDPLYEDEGYPVVIVQSYDEVTTENLMVWQRKFANAFGPDLSNKLRNDYWVDRIRAVSEDWRQRTEGTDYSAARRKRGSANRDLPYQMTSP